MKPNSLSVILDRAERLASMSKAEQERALAGLRASAKRVADSCGVATEDGERMAEELANVLRVAAIRGRSARLLH